MLDKYKITRGYISEMEAPGEQPKAKPAEKSKESPGDLDPSAPDGVRMSYQHALDMSDQALQHSVNLKRNHAKFSADRDFNSLDQGHREAGEVHGNVQKVLDGIGALAKHQGREDLANAAQNMSKLHGDIAEKHAKFQYHPEVEKRSGV